MERDSKRVTAENVDAYIRTFPEDVQVKLQQLRKAIRESAPDAEEGISYGMPGYKLNGHPLAYFAAFKHHIGFYPTPSGMAAFEKELARYKQGKGSVQFPLDEPVPVELVKKMVRSRIEENKEKKARRKEAKQKRT
ncbi:MAG: iron chaperone [Candidatus Saccharibacteria bacterium]